MEWKQLAGYSVTKTKTPGVWKVKEGGYFLRASYSHEGKRHEVSARSTAPSVPAAAEELRALLASRKATAATPESGPRELWSEFAAEVFLSKCDQGKLASEETRAKWRSTLERYLFPAFGELPLAEVSPRRVAAWVAQLSEWVTIGRDVGDGKIRKLGPRTANGVIRIFRVICNRAAKLRGLPSPCAGVDFFEEAPAYSYEAPNALDPARVPEALAAMRRDHPYVYAMVLLGFVTGLRPSSLRPLRRSGPEADLRWSDGRLLIRRSHTCGQIVMAKTKTGKNLEHYLPAAVLGALREHVEALPPGPARESIYLFPAEHGGMLSRGALVRPFRALSKALGLPHKITPRAMRRTFQDLARGAKLADVVTRSISGHATAEMQLHYSTAGAAERRAALASVVGIALGRHEPAEAPEEPFAPPSPPIVVAPLARVPDGSMGLQDFAASIGVPYGTIKRWAFAEGLPILRSAWGSVHVDPTAAGAWVAEHKKGSVSFARVGWVCTFRRTLDGALRVGCTNDVARRLAEFRKAERCPVEVTDQRRGTPADAEALAVEIGAKVGSWEVPRVSAPRVLARV